MSTALFSLRRLPLAIRNFRTPVTVTNHVGAIGPKPPKYYNLGSLKVSLLIAPFLYIGYYLGGEFADVIERLDLYVPDDEDDDDD